MERAKCVHPQYAVQEVETTITRAKEQKQTQYFCTNCSAHGWASPGKAITWASTPLLVMAADMRHADHLALEK